MDSNQLRAERIELTPRVTSCVTSMPSTRENTARSVSAPAPTSQICSLTVPRPSRRMRCIHMSSPSVGERCSAKLFVAKRSIKLVLPLPPSPSTAITNVGSTTLAPIGQPRLDTTPRGRGRGRGRPNSEFLFVSALNNSIHTSPCRPVPSRWGVFTLGGIGARKISALALHTAAHAPPYPPSAPTTAQQGSQADSALSPRCVDRSPSRSVRAACVRVRAFAVACFLIPVLACLPRARAHRSGVSLSRPMKNSRGFCPLEPALLPGSTPVSGVQHPKVTEVKILTLT